MRLDDLPSGSRCFLDANMLIYQFTAHPDHSPPCATLLRRIGTGEVEGFASALTISEALHHIMLADVKACYAPPKPLAHIQRHPSLVSTLANYQSAAKAIGFFNITLLPTDFALFADAAVLGAQFNLLTNDACTLALLRRHQLTDLATNDDDFNNLPGVTVWNPR